MNKHTVPGDAGYDYRRFDKVNIAQKIIKVLLISTWNTAKLIEEILLVLTLPSSKERGFLATCGGAF